MLVLIVELLNSAIEAVVDRVSPDLHDLSKRAKDIGSAAVMLALVTVRTLWARALWHRLERGMTNALSRVRLLRVARRRRPAYLRSGRTHRHIDRPPRLAAGLRRRPVGLMGAVADAALAAGGRVVGVIPRIADEARGRPHRPDANCTSCRRCTSASR